MRQVLISLVFVLLFVVGSCGGEDEKINSSSVQGIWKEMFVDIVDTCEGQNKSSIPSVDSYIKIVLDKNNLLRVYHLSECDEDGYDDCYEDMLSSGSVLAGHSLLLSLDKTTGDLGDLPDNTDCKVIMQEELVINFKDVDNAEFAFTASHKTTGKDCDSEVVNEYLNGDYYGSLNYKDCSYKEIVQIKKVGDAVEEENDDDDDFDDDSCTDGEKKCADTTFMWCTGGLWVTQDCEDSGKVCNETKGCVNEDYFVN